MNTWESFAGRRLSPMGSASHISEPVNAAMVRHWTDVIGGEWERVPLPMLSVWAMPGYRSSMDGTRWNTDERSLDVLRIADGYTGILATNFEERYERQLTFGELLVKEDIVEAVSERKLTALGEGRFVSYGRTVRDLAGVVVGSSHIRVFYYRPEPSSTPTKLEGTRKSIAPLESHSNELLTELKVPVTTSFIVAGALATRDFEPVHHDTAHARKEGLPDIVMNILTHLGFCGRVAASSSSLRGIALRLALPCLPGDELHYKAYRTEAGTAVTATSARGLHLVGTVTQQPETGNGMRGAL